MNGRKLIKQDMIYDWSVSTCVHISSNILIHQDWLEASHLK